jgi:hypothetical protein
VGGAKGVFARFCSIWANTGDHFVIPREESDDPYCLMLVEQLVELVEQLAKHSQLAESISFTSKKKNE